MKEKQKNVNFLWINAKGLLKELVSGPIVLRRKLVNFFPPSVLVYKMEHVLKSILLNQNKTLSYVFSLYQSVTNSS
jgi:hypothetical protein